METIGWGILGAGDIAGLVAEDLARVPGARLEAVGSRSGERARRFGDRFDCTGRYGSHAALVEDPAVDVVHVATPHPIHREHTLLALEADFGFRPERDPDGRLFDPSLAGGALLDIGVNPISLASWLMGPAEEIRTLGHLGQTGVDEQGAVLLSHGDARHSVLAFTFLSESPTVATMAGDGGRITMDRRWWSAESAPGW